MVSSQDNPHGNLAWECADCHTTKSWKHLADAMKFEHKETGFRLEGSHQSVACGSCHGELVFSHVGTACADCHSDHHQGQLGNECQNCHVTRNWEPQTDLLIQHADRGFPLTGVHAVADCEACHATGGREEFAGTPTECEVCHASDLAGATNPDHSGLAFSTDCQRCHHAAFGSWERTTFEHPHSFPLTGAHLSVECRECHTTDFAAAQPDCYSCHTAAYNSTTEPNHVLADFSTDCQACHTTIAWVPSDFDHALTAFPLEGRHVGVNCGACHQTSYAGTSTDCYSCHQSDFEGTSDPGHLASAFPTSCETCHTVAGWEPATFDHALTSFPLEGRHVGVNCNACHQSGYSGTPTACYACHQPDYEGTNDPNHLAASFPTTCENCHTAAGWEPANWDHDAEYFPIFSGPHRNEWGNCSECHTVSTSFAVFDCTNCHEHRQSEMDDKHSDVNNYEFSSSACYTCHPNGRE